MLAKPTQFVRDVFRATRLDNLFAIHDSEEEGIASFALPDSTGSIEAGEES
jgi:hypothetical protein